jgi:hypothetical protein
MIVIRAICTLLHQVAGSFLCACIGTQFLSLYKVIPCKVSAKGTATVGTKIQGNVAIVEVLKSLLVMTPRVTALTRSAIPRTLHTTTAYFDQLYPFHRKRAKGIAVTPMRISPIPAGIAKAGSNSPCVIPHRKTIPRILHVWTPIRTDVVLLYRICFE